MVGMKTYDVMYLTASWYMECTSGVSSPCSDASSETSSTMGRSPSPTIVFFLFLFDLGLLRFPGGVTLDSEARFRVNVTVDDPRSSELGEGAGEGYEPAARDARDAATCLRVLRLGGL